MPGFPVPSAICNENLLCPPRPPVLVMSLMTDECGCWCGRACSGIACDLWLRDRCKNFSHAANSRSRRFIINCLANTLSMSTNEAFPYGDNEEAERLIYRRYSLHFIIVLSVYCLVHIVVLQYIDGEYTSTELQTIRVCTRRWVWLREIRGSTRYTRAGLYLMSVCHSHAESVQAEGFGATLEFSREHADPLILCPRWHLIAPRPHTTRCATSHSSIREWAVAGAEAPACITCGCITCMSSTCITCMYICIKNFAL